MGAVGLEPAVAAREKGGDAGGVDDPARGLRAGAPVLPRPGDRLGAAFHEGDLADAGRPQKARALGDRGREDLLVEHGAVDLVSREADVVLGTRLTAVGESARPLVVEPEAHPLLDQVLL